MFYRWTPEFSHLPSNTVVLTFADGPITSVAGFTRAAVASDHVEAQGILIAVVESTEAFVMFWRPDR